MTCVMATRYQQNNNLFVPYTNENELKRGFRKYQTVQETKTRQRQQRARQSLSSAVTTCPNNNNGHSCNHTVTTDSNQTSNATPIRRTSSIVSMNTPSQPPLACVTQADVETKEIFWTIADFLELRRLASLLGNKTRNKKRCSILEF